MYCLVENLFNLLLNYVWYIIISREREKGFLIFVKEILGCNILRDFKFLENYKIIFMVNKGVFIFWTGFFFLLKYFFIDLEF